MGRVHHDAHTTHFQQQFQVWIEVERKLGSEAMIHIDDDNIMVRYVLRPVVPLLEQWP
jgi:hypothetical protein